MSKFSLYWSIWDIEINTYIFYTIKITNYNEANMKEHITRKDLFVHDMVHNNPGELQYESIYNSPDFLKSRGYDGKCFDLFNCAQYALLWDNIAKKHNKPPIFPEGSDGRKWVLDCKNRLSKLYDDANSCGLDVYCHMDVIVFPIEVTKVFPEIHNKDGKIDIALPITKTLIEDMFDELFREFPCLQGIYVRYGETYTGEQFGAPYHTGNNPILDGNYDYHVLLMNCLKKIVCEKHQRKVFYRTWSYINGVGFDPFQYDHDTYLKISDQVSPHENFYTCIKHTTKDFHRCSRFNQALNCGQHNQIVEVQCAREYEGKGAYPNYIAGGVINGFEEDKWTASDEKNRSLRDVINVSNSKIKGVWTWSRGGGWGGPYIIGKNGINGEDVIENGSELWCDLNAYVISQWAKDTSKSDRYYVLKFATEELKMSKKDSLIFYEICTLSARAVLLGKSCCENNPDWDMEWTRDQNINPTKLLSNVQNIIDTNIVDEMLWWKKQSVDIWKQIVQFSEQITSGNSIEYIKTTCKYGFYLYSIYETMYRANIYAKIGKDFSSAIKEYDLLWDDFIKLKENNKDCPTLFHKSGRKGIVGYTCYGFDDVIDNLRN